MNIYYDADCSICEKCKNMVFKLTNQKLNFLDISNSSFKEEIEKTIVVVFDEKEYRYGKAIKVIVSKLVFPFNLFSYLPIFILDLNYAFLRFIKTRFSKKVCKI